MPTTTKTSEAIRSFLRTGAADGIWAASWPSLRIGNSCKSRSSFLTSIPAKAFASGRI